MLEESAYQIQMWKCVMLELKNGQILKLVADR